MQRSPIGFVLPPPVPHSGMATAPGLSQSMGPTPGMMTPSYGAPYPPMSGSLPTPSSGLSDPMSGPEPDSATPHLSPNSHHALAAQKRAYRQRRKDPSCDACRERKVKCDATDATSCSECSSRAVKCQFTKETNRRMSSMKQVQDLERQLQQAKQQISQLRGMMQENGALNGQAAPVSALAIPENPPNRERAHPPRLMSNFFKVRRNIRNYGRGIFKPPQAYRTPGIQVLCQDSNTALPPKHVADKLLAQYRAIVHPFAPILHWPIFQSECDALYRAGTFQGTKKIWMAVFFAALACGTQVQDTNAGTDTNGQSYAETAMRNVNTHTDEVTIDHARATLLISVYFMECNMRSAGWIWLSAAVRTAQESALHCDPGPNSQQAELRRRVWWSIYNWDRLCSLEMGQPPSIADSDVDVSEPMPVDDESIGANGLQTATGHVAPSTLIIFIPVVRIIYQLKKTLKSRTITPATLKIYDEHFNSIMDSYPDPFPIASTSPLDPGLLHPALSLQMARFFLYRHNLSVACRPQERHDALSRCMLVAKDTAHYIYRTTPAARSHAPRLAIHPPDGTDPEWQSRLRTAAPSLVCTHLWRCTLILSLCGEYAPALTCVAAMSAIGDHRRINNACGRNLAFFLDRLIDQLHAGKGADVQSDEEMLAYASADLQGCHDSAWAWTGSEAVASLGASSSPNSYRHGSDSSSPEMAQTVLLTKEEEQEWGGWQRVEGLLRQLHHGQPSRAPLPPSQGPPPLPSLHQYAPDPHGHQQQYAPDQHNHYRQTSATPQQTSYFQPSHQYPPPPARSPYGSTQVLTPTRSSVSTTGSSAGQPVSRISIKDIM